jgi:hypothetical protein
VIQQGVRLDTLASQDLQTGRDQYNSHVTGSFFSKTDARLLSIDNR